MAWLSNLVRAANIAQSAELRMLLIAKARDAMTKAAFVGFPSPRPFPSLIAQLWGSTSLSTSHLERKIRPVVDRSVRYATGMRIPGPCILYLVSLGCRCICSCRPAPAALAIVSLLLAPYNFHLGRGNGGAICVGR